MGESRIDLRGFVDILRRRRGTLLAIVVATAALAFGLSLLQHDRFKASADLLFRKSDVAQTLFKAAVQTDASRQPERDAATNLALSSLEVVAQRVKQQLDSPLSVEKLRKRIEVKPKGQADIVTITASAPTRRDAVRLANTFAQGVVQFRREAAVAPLERSIAILRAKIRQGSETGAVGKSLPGLVDDLDVLKSLQTGDVSIVQPATPPRQRSSPKPLRNAAIGGLLGLILGIMALLLVNRLTGRVRDDQEISNIFAVPVLAHIPVDRPSRVHRQQFFEGFQFLRANVQFEDPSRELKVIAVTSPRPGDGKSTVAVGLARALALSGLQVIVVDCDLRRPMLHNYLGVSSRTGLTDVLVDERDPLQALQQTSDPGVQLLAAGPVLLTPSSIVAGMERLPSALARLAEEADYVVMDTPPVSVAAEASAAVNAADGVILVVDQERVSRDRLVAAREQLSRTRAKFLGVVLNRTADTGADYSYGYALEQQHGAGHEDGEDGEDARNGHAGAGTSPGAKPAPPRRGR